MTDITILGTAATMPGKERALSAALLGCEGRAILFDCGEGTQTAMKRCAVSPMKIDVIALTHYHGDHIFGLPGLLQSMSCYERTEPLYITGPEGLEDILSPIMQLAGETGFPVISLTVPEKGISLCELHPAWPERAALKSFETRHRVISQGYRFDLSRGGRFLTEKAEALGVPRRYWSQLQRGINAEFDGKTVEPSEVMTAERKGISAVFSGDTAPCEELIKAACGADVLICDGTYGDDADSGEAEKYGHSTYRQAAELACAAGAGKLVLTHFSQKMKNPESLLSNSAAFPNTVCAYDGMKIALNFED